jgi:hypothetical protein
MSGTLRRITSAVMLFVLVAAAGISSQPPATAQQGGSGLQISPTRYELDIVPGEVGIITFTLKNVTASDIVAQASLNDFESDGDTGQPKLIIDESEPRPTSLKKFVDNLTDVELEAGETKEIKLNLDVPVDTAPGAYFGAVRYAAIPKEVIDDNDNRQVALTASVASLVLLTVPGDVTESVSFDSLNVEKNENAGTFFTDAPQEVALKLSNTGNSFIRPFGKVSVYKGSNEVYSYELNNTEPRGNVLPGSSRTFRSSIENVGGFGKYKVVANVSYSEGGELLTQEKVFYVIPIWLWAVIGLLVIGLVVGIYLLRRKMVYKGKSSNKRK